MATVKIKLTGKRKHIRQVIADIQSNIDWDSLDVKVKVCHGKKVK